MKDDKLYVMHINECIKRIESYTSGGHDTFMASILIQDAVLRNLQTLGESARRLSSDLKATHPGAEWAGVSGFRNMLVHDYMDLNMELIWKVIERDLPPFKKIIADILNGITDS